MKVVDVSPIETVINLCQLRSRATATQLQTVFRFETTMSPAEAERLRRALERVSIELRHAIEEGRQNVLMSISQDIPQCDEASIASNDTLAAAEERAARAVISRALMIADGRRELAAELLGITQVTLWRRMKALGLVVESEVVQVAV